MTDLKKNNEVPARKRGANINPAAHLASAGTSPEALNTRQDTATESEDALDDELGAEPGLDLPPAEEESPKVRTRKVAAAEAALPKKAKPQMAVVKPTDDFVRDKKGNVTKDEDGDDMRFAAGFHKGAGYVNENGVRFPPHFKFPGGHIGTRGNVVLNRCPKCRNHNSIDEAMLGKCANQECGFSVIEELEEYTL